METKEFAEFLNDLDKSIEERKNELVKEISSFYKDEEFDIVHCNTPKQAREAWEGEFHSFTVTQLEVYLKDVKAGLIH